MLDEMGGEHVNKFKGQLREEKVDGRRLTVYLPPSYEKTLDTYPVVYFQDGGDLFAPDRSDVLPRLERMMGSCKLPELMLVGVEPCHRLNDYSPWPVPAHASRYSRHAFGGQGDRYLEKLSKLIKPYVDSHYRTKPEREHTALVGASLGALISLYAAYTHPSIYSRIGCLSTSIWFEGFMDYMNRHQLDSQMRIYMDIGLQESRSSSYQDQELLRLTEAAFKQIKASGVPDDQIILVRDEHGRHRPSAFIRRLPEALEWLYHD